MKNQINYNLSPFSNYILRLFLLLLIIVPINVYSGKKHTYLLENGVECHGEPAGETSPKIDLKEQGILGEKMENIQKMFGKTEMFDPNSSSAISPEVLCYASEDDKDKTLLVIESGPMGGFGRTVSSYAIYADKGDFPHYQRCLKTKKVTRNISTQNGISLSTTKDNAKNILGSKITCDVKGHLLYWYDKKIVMSEEQYQKHVRGHENDIPQPSNFYFRSAFILLEYRDIYIKKISVGAFEST
ncbi:MAG TPA: hypothetical protein PKH10_07130 [bacterium]|nr:hypothetical protein [bacterium]